MTDSMREKVAIGNAMATWLASFISRCLDAGLKVWVENPSGSYLWLHPAWVRIIRKYSLKTTSRLIIVGGEPHGGSALNSMAIFGTAWKS